MHADKHFRVLSSMPGDGGSVGYLIMNHSAGELNAVKLCLQLSLASNSRLQQVVSCAALHLLKIQEESSIMVPKVPKEPSLHLLDFMNRKVLHSYCKMPKANSQPLEAHRRVHSFH